MYSKPRTTSLRWDTPISDSSQEKAGVVKETERRFGDGSYWLVLCEKEEGMHGAVARSLATGLDIEGRTGMRPLLTALNVKVAIET